MNKEKCKNDRKNDRASFNQTNELIGYQNSADFCEIWLEHSLDVMKRKCVGDFWHLYFTRGDLQCNAPRVFFAARTLQINFKITRISENADTLLIIDPLWLTLRSYFASALGFNTLLIQLNDTWSFSWLFAIFFCGIKKPAIYIFSEIYIY